MRCWWHVWDLYVSVFWDHLFKTLFIKGVSPTIYYFCSYVLVQTDRRSLTSKHFNCSHPVVFLIIKEYTNFSCVWLLLWWRYSQGWALASFTICLQASRSLALSLHSFIPIFLRSVDTSSSHLIFGLPLRLVACSFPYNIFFGFVVSRSFYMIKPSYSLACNEPENVFPLDYNF